MSQQTLYNDLVITGDLTVSGATTTISTTNLIVEDKNIILGNVDGTPTNVTADGGGITLRGATDKTFNWTSSTSSWTSSEDLNLSSGKVYEINGTSVLSSTTLGSGVTGSSLTSVGTIGTGTWAGTIISPTYGGTGINNGVKTITLGGNLTTSGAFATTLTVTDITNVTLPTSGTLATRDYVVSLVETTFDSSITGSGKTFTNADDGKVFHISGTNTLVLPSYATANSGWSIGFVNVGGATLTLNIAGGSGNSINDGITISNTVKWSSVYVYKSDISGKFIAIGVLN